MRTIRRDLRDGRCLAGVWCNLGCPQTADIAARSGYDWILIDTEHGVADDQATRQSIAATAAYPCAPIVRVPAPLPHLLPRLLDAAAAGLMLPQVRDPDTVRDCVAAMTYPPDGRRGVSRINTATGYGLEFETYRTTTANQLACIVQIETSEALDQVEAIACIDGVDALFVGPMDLSYAVGTPTDVSSPAFQEAKARIVAACRSAGIAAGILLASADQVAPHLAEGFTMLGLGSDAGMVAQGMQAARAALP